MRWLFLCLTLLTVGWVVSPATAAATEFVEPQGVVERVTIRGNRLLEEAAVLAHVGLRSGERLTADKVRRDIKSIYRAGYYDDVVVKLKDLGDGRVEVIFEVTEKPRVLDVRLEGNKKIDEEDLRELIDVRDFGVLNDAHVAETIRLLRDKYVEKGFYLAEIEPEIVEITDDAVDVVFHITENRKVIVQRIEFSGNEHVPDSKIKRFMQTKEGGFAPWLTQSGNFDRDMLDADMQVIQLVFLEEGYVDARVEPPKVYLSPDKRYIYISFSIDEGEQYEVGEIEVQGDFVEEEGLTEEAALEIVDGRLVADVQEEQWRIAQGKNVRSGPKPRRGTPLETGEPFQYSLVGQTAQNISTLYQDQGYAFVNVNPRWVPDKETQTVDLIFDVDKGEKVRIGRIHISGNDPTFDKVIRREILLSEGDIYRGSLVDASKLRLQRLGFFEDVKVGTPRGEQPGTLDLNFKVTEQPTGSFSLGLGYSNLEKLAVNGSISKNNFLGLGFTLSASINWSALRRQASVSFFDPYFADSRWTLKLDGYWIERRFQLTEFQRGATLGVGRYLDRKDDLQLRLEYTIEDVGITSLDEYRQRLLGGALFRNGLTSTLGVSMIFDRRNNRIFPTNGFFLTGSVALSGGFRTSPDDVVSVLGGDFNFVEAKLNFRLYQPLIPKSDWLIFRWNTTMGSVWSTDGRVIPFIHRYRAGGINSVRGFQWFSLGPTVRVLDSDNPTENDNNLVVGGTQTWINNFEIVSPIVRAAGISAVVLFDAGNTFGNPWAEGGINPLRLRTAAGFGVRWRSPIGPLRFELGFPLRPREDERRSVFDFSIGSFF